MVIDRSAYLLCRAWCCSHGLTLERDTGMSYGLVRSAHWQWRRYGTDEELCHLREVEKNCHRLNHYLQIELIDYQGLSSRTAQIASGSARRYALGIAVGNAR